MSYIYFDINGRLREYVTTPKRKGSENIDTLCVYWEGNDGTVVLPSQCFIEYGHESIHAGPLTANKISRTIIPFERERDLRFFQYGKTYQFMCFDLPTAVSSTSGFWHSSVSIHDRLTDNVVQVLGDITFEIEESSIVPSGNLNLSQYNYILDNIKDIEGNLDSKLDKTTPTSIINGNGDKVVDFASEKVTIHKKAQSIETPVEAKDIANKEYVDTKVSAETEGVVKRGDLKTLNGESLLGSGDISYDDSLSPTSTNAVQNKVINSTISELSYQLAMVRENLFQTVLSEIDYTEDFATIYPIPDTLSDTDGTHRVLFSETQLREVAGNSVAYNQLCEDNFGDSTDYWSHNRTTQTNNNNVATFISSSNTYIQVSFYHYFSAGQLIKGHKYLANIKVRLTSGLCTDFRLYMQNDYTILQNPQLNVWNDLSLIWTNTRENTQIVNGIVTQRTYSSVDDIVVGSDSFEARVPQLFDLTLMGLDSVSTVEEARSELLKRGIDIDQYNPFSEGEIRNTTASGVKVNGYNLFDGEFEIGGYYTSTGGNDDNSTDRIRTKNALRVIAGQTYLLEVTNLSYSKFFVLEYDKNDNYLNEYKITNPIVLQPNCFYVRFMLTGPTSVPTNSNACFHLSTLRTGYAPYKEPKAISFASTELLGAGEAHDTIEVVEGDKVAGIQRYNLVHVKRVGTVDLGTLGWNVADISTNRSFVYFPGAKLFDNDKVANIVSSRFKADTYDDVGSNMSGLETISLGKIGENPYLYVKTGLITASTNTTEKIKTAMNGVILNYELATPTRTTIAENLTFEEVSATIEQGGSIETVYENLAPNCTTGFVVKKATEVSK